MAMLGLDVSGFLAGTNRATSAAASAGQKIGSSLGDEVSGRLKGLVTLGALEEITRRTIEYGDEIVNLSRRLGIGYEAVQAWDYALKLNGSSIQSATTFFERLAVARQKALAGQDEQTAAFKRLGLTLDDLKSKRLEDIALQIAQVFSSGDPQKLIADLREVGGRGAGEMVAAFRDGLAELIANAKDAGVIMGDNVVDGLKQAADRSKTIWMQFIAGLAPAIDTGSKMLQGFWRGLQTAGDAAVGMFYKGAGGASAAVKELEDKFAEQDRLEKELRDKRAKPPAAGGLGDEETATGKKSALREIATLQEQLARKQQANDLAQLTTSQKLDEILKRRAAAEVVLAAETKAGHTKDMLKAAIGLEDIDAEFERASKEMERGDKKSGRGVGTRDLNALQRVGAFSGQPLESQALAVHHKVAANTHEMKELLKKIAEHHRTAAPAEMF